MPSGKVCSLSTSPLPAAQAPTGSRDSADNSQHGRQAGRQAGRSSVQVTVQETGAHLHAFVGNLLPERCRGFTAQLISNWQGYHHVQIYPCAHLKLVCVGRWGGSFLTLPPSPTNKLHTKNKTLMRSNSKSAFYLFIWFKLFGFILVGSKDH